MKGVTHWQYAEYAVRGMQGSVGWPLTIWLLVLSLFAALKLSLRDLIGGKHG